MIRLPPDEPGPVGVERVNRIRRSSRRVYDSAALVEPLDDSATEVVTGTPQTLFQAGSGPAGTVADRAVGHDSVLAVLRYELVHLPWGQMKDPGKPGHLMRCVNQGNRTINPDPPTYHNTHHEAGERGGRGGNNGSNLPLLRKDPQAT